MLKYLVPPYEYNIYMYVQLLGSSILLKFLILNYGWTSPLGAYVILLLLNVWVCICKYVQIHTYIYISLSLSKGIRDCCDGSVSKADQKEQLGHTVFTTALFMVG